MNILYRPNSLLKNATRQKLIVISDSETLCPEHLMVICQLRSAQMHTTRQHAQTHTYAAACMLHHVDSYMVAINLSKKYAPTHIPANMSHSPNAVPLLVHRLWRWPNIKTASGECLVLLVRLVLARRALRPVCAAGRESTNSHDSRPT